MQCIYLPRIQMQALFRCTSEYGQYPELSPGTSTGTTRQRPPRKFNETKANIMLATNLKLQGGKLSLPGYWSMLMQVYATEATEFRFCFSDEQTSSFGTLNAVNLPKNSLLQWRVFWRPQGINLFRILHLTVKLYSYWCSDRPAKNKGLFKKYTIFGMVN